MANDQSMKRVSKVSKWVSKWVSIGYLLTLNHYCGEQVSK